MTTPDLFAYADRQGSINISDVPPDVVDLFERFALEIQSRGFDQYSARAILHRIRWHHHIDKGNRDFKCNNNWTPSTRPLVHGEAPEPAKILWDLYA